MARVLCNRFGWRLKLIKLSWHMFDLRIIWSSDSKCGTSILSNFWNSNPSFKMNLYDDLGISTSGGIFLTDHAIDSRKQTNIFSIRWGSVKVSFVGHFSDVFNPSPSLVNLFAKLFTMHREKTLPPNTLTSNRWLSPSAYPIILPKLKNFPHFQRHFQKGQFCKVAKHLDRWKVFCEKKEDYILSSQNFILLPIVLFEIFRFFGPHDWMGQTIIYPWPKFFWKYPPPHLKNRKLLNDLG